MSVDFSHLDTPSAAFIEKVRRRYATETETDALLVRKMQHRSHPPFRRQTLTELSGMLEEMLADTLEGGFEVSDQRWFTGGVSKIQMGFTLRWTDPHRGERTERMVLRMDPSESMNTTSRVREFEFIKAFTGVIPVPEMFFLDRDGRWFPEPALVYSFVDGVTKPRSAVTGKVSGLGTVFGPDLRAKLAPQFMSQLAKIHTFDPGTADFASMDRPRPGHGRQRPLAARPRPPHLGGRPRRGLSVDGSGRELVGAQCSCSRPRRRGARRLPEWQLLVR